MYPAISTPTPKKLLAMASSQSPRMEFINLSPKTLLPRSWPLTTASTECVLTLGILPLVDPNLLNSSFVSPLLLSLTPYVVQASPPTPLPWLSYLFCLTMHFPTLSIFVLHRPGRSSSAMVFDLDVNPVPPLPLLKSFRPPPLSFFYCWRAPSPWSH